MSVKDQGMSQLCYIEASHMTINMKPKDRATRLTEDNSAK